MTRDVTAARGLAAGSRFGMAETQSASAIRRRATTGAPRRAPEPPHLHAALNAQN
jgi:hypothetical protein